MEPQSGDKARFRGVNALRAAAAIAVVGFHLPLTPDIAHNRAARLVLGDLNIGVSLFFVISGFLLFRPFVVSLLRGQPASISSYARNRALRILPLYLFVGLIAIWRSPSLQSLSVIARSISFTGVYSTAVPSQILGVAWSLDDEVVYYILLPMVFLAIRALGKVEYSRLVAVVASLVGISLLYQLVVFSVLRVNAFGPARDQVLNLNPLSKFQLFGFGMLLATIEVRLVRARLSKPHVLTFVAMFLFSLPIGIIALHRLLPVADLVLGIGFTALLATVVLSDQSSRAVLVLSAPPIVLLGEFSYGLYLWHVPVMVELARYHVLQQSAAVNYVLVLGASLALAAMTYFAIERPALRLKTDWIARRTVQGAAAPAASAY